MHSRIAPPRPRHVVRALVLVALIAAPGAVLAQSAAPQQAALPPGDAPTSGASGASAAVVSVIDLIGRQVVAPAGERVAVVHDMVFSTADGRVRAALAPVGGGGLVAAPTEGLRLKADGSLLINADRATVAALPPLDPAGLSGGSPSTDGLMVRGGPIALTPPGR